MSCILRISGKNMNVDQLLQKTTLKPYHFYRKGEPVFKTSPKGKKSVASGVSFCTSKADFDNVGKQIKDTIRYLLKHKTELKKILKDKYITNAMLDFGIELRMGYDNIALQSDTFPHTLLKLAAELKINVGFSLYWPDEDDKDKKA